MFGRRYLLLLLTLTALSILYKWASARANLGYFSTAFWAPPASAVGTPSQAGGVSPSAV